MAAAVDQKYTELASASSASVNDIVCAVQGATVDVNAGSATGGTSRRMNIGQLLDSPDHIFTTTQHFRPTIGPAIVCDHAPPVSANYGLLSLGAGPFDGSATGHFVGNTAGTHLAVNAASSFTGNMVDVQIAGVSRFSIGVNGISSPWGAVDSFFGVIDSERYGASAGNSTSTGVLNTAVGYKTLVASTSGNENTCVGGIAGQSLTTGSSNTLIGSQAGALLTTGSANCVLAQFGLRVATTGSGNIVIGVDAGLTITTGNNNILIGSDGTGLYANTSTGATTNGIAIGVGATCGNDGIALGRSATAGANEFKITSQVTIVTLTGKNVTITPATAAGVGLIIQGVSSQAANVLEVRPTGTTTPTFAVSVSTGASAPFGSVDGFFGVPTSERFGNGAGNLTASNNGNTAFGFQALTALTSGSLNTAVGSLAGPSITTGSSNAVVGQFALRSLTTGTGNVAVGEGAALGLITGGGNILIGGNGTVFTTTAASDTTNGIAIGIQAVCGNDGIALGRSVTAAANEFAITSQVTTVTLKAVGATTLQATGTGANGLVLKNLKNSANTTFGGTVITIEVNVGGTPYYIKANSTSSA